MGSNRFVANGHPSLAIRYGTFLFRARNAIFPLALLGLIIFFPPVFAWTSAWADIEMDIVGLAVGFAGIVLRAAVVGTAYIKRGGVNRRVYADQLVTEGIFAHVRNPLYVGNILILAGLFIVANNPWGYLLGIGFFLVSYMSIVAAEETYLLEKFGAEYAAYCRSVPRWWINFRGLRRTLRNYRINWRRIVVKEYTSIATWILMNLVVFAYEEFINEALADAASEIAAAAVGMTVTGVLVLTVRGLKKSGVFNSGHA
ncbi:MAG: methyltransferase family protein [Rhodospirillales bacterium]